MSDKINTSDFTAHTLKEMREREERYKNRFTGSRHEMTEEEKTHWDRIRSAQVSGNKPMTFGEAAGQFLTLQKESKNHEKKQAPEMSYQDGRILLWNIILEVQEREGFRYVFNDSQREIIQNLILYFLGQPGAYDLKKGIYLYGNVGRGKTEIMRLFARFCFLIKYNQFSLASCKGIVYDMSQQKDVSVLNQYFDGVICLDDFGFEERESNVWGNKVRAIETIIEERYREKRRTHATSNLPIDFIEQHGIYDDRIVSRCHEMFNFIMVDGIDHRKK